MSQLTQKPIEKFVANFTFFRLEFVFRNKIIVILYPTNLQRQAEGFKNTFASENIKEARWEVQTTLTVQTTGVLET